MKKFRKFLIKFFNSSLVTSILSRGTIVCFLEQLEHLMYLGPLVGLPQSMHNDCFVDVFLNG